MRRACGDERGGEHLDVGVHGQGEALDRLGGVERERVLVDVELPGLLRSRRRCRDRLVVSAVASPAYPVVWPSR